ncbi:MAG TPA: alpha-L-arabinofuranosidase, partial [Puia sp.]|nr:alpha-L-arabinofuranosidase [Puia sp.]
MKPYIVIFLLLGAAACKKSGSPSSNNNNNNSNPTQPADSNYNPVDPALPPTVGFFGNGWKGRTFNAPPENTTSVSTSLPVSDSLVIDVNRVLAKVPPTVFGNNSNLWMGQIVTQASLMQYIGDLSPNIIRAPAGSISDTYFWNGSDANPKPADAPDSVYTSGSLGSIGSWYGGDNASWTLSLSNYYSLLAQTGSTAIFTVNYGYARYGTGTSPVDSAAHLAASWVRSDNGRTKFWEIGNECYGSWEAGYQIDPARNHDGQPAIVTGALYGTHFKVFADSMRAAAQSIGATIYIGAVLYGTPPQSYDDNTVQTWNQGVLANAGSTADFFIVHDYFTGYNTNSTVPQILSTGLSEAPAVMTYVKQQLQ